MKASRKADKSMTFYVNSKKKSAPKEIAQGIAACISRHKTAWEEIVLLCIGSDRITGDCLGPYVGHQLSDYVLEGLTVYGTIHRPVHALNLSRAIQLINRRHPHALLIAVDASLGTRRHLGYISIGNGALYPGSGVQKELPAVGDIFITGIVNTSGFLEQMTRQTTRLSQVVTLGDSITQGILMAFCHPCSYAATASCATRLCFKK